MTIRKAIANFEAEYVPSGIRETPEWQAVLASLPTAQAAGMWDMQIAEQRLALSRITERYPPDTVAGRLATDVLAKYPNRYENADRENDSIPAPVPEIEGLTLGPSPSQDRLRGALLEIAYHKTDKPCSSAWEEDTRTLLEAQRMAFDALAQTQSQAQEGNDG